VQALRRVPHTFFDAYFSGRYAQDVCQDGSIFVDRDGEQFGHVLEYMRDGVVSVVEPGACPSVSLLRSLKREFDFYCIELVAEEVAEPALSEMAFAMGGRGGRRGKTLSSMERYDASSGEWSVAANMGIKRRLMGACALVGEVYVTGGQSKGINVSYVEKYSPSTDTWSTLAPLPGGRSCHAAVAVGSVMYVLGGNVGQNTVITPAASVLKFDSTQGTWSEVAPMPEVRHAFAACVVGSDIFVFGAYNNLSAAQASVFKYDTVANVWSSLDQMLHVSRWHTASVMDGLVYLVGAGRSGDDVLRFAPASGSWITLAPTLNVIHSSSSFVLGGCLYAVGGQSRPSGVERYDVTSNT
jgi:non-specific serine/threonine protein kinase